MSVNDSIESQPAQFQRLTTIAQAGFLLVGMVNTMLGPILPLLSEQWRMNDAEAGRLFLAQFAGAMIGSASSSPLINRFGAASLIAGGYGLMAASAAALGFSGPATGLLAVFGLGLSLGLVIPATNLLIAEANPNRRAAALNLLNLVWGLGAIAFPLLIAALPREGGLRWLMSGLAALLAAASLMIARRAGVKVQADADRDLRLEKQPVWRALMEPYALMTGALIFIYVGTETAAGGWIASYADRVRSGAHSLRSMAPSFFWAGVLAGRFLAPLFLRRVTEGALVLMSLCGAVAGLLVVIGVENLFAVSTGACLTGFGLAAVFPTTFAIFTQHFGAQAARLTGFVFVLASLGGATMPWAVGLASSQFGDLRTAMVVPLLGAVSMIALQVAIIRIKSRVADKKM
jgi:fucose permease